MLMIHHQPHNSKGNYNYNAFAYQNCHWSPHFHKNFEMIYVISGEIQMTVGGNTSTMQAEDYCLVLSNQIHAIDPSPNSLIWIAVFSEQFVPYFAKHIKELEGVSSVFRCDSDVDELLKSNLIFSEGSLMMKKACFYAFCDQFMKKIPLEKRKNRNDELICKIIDYVSEHYKENLSLYVLAKEFGYEYHYLSRLLNTGYRLNFSTLVNQYRVDCAIDLLTNTDMSITDIAMYSGFHSLRTFNHTFKAITGHTPSGYIESV